MNKTILFFFCILATTMSQQSDIQSNSTQPVRYAIKMIGENAKCNEDHEFCCDAPSNNANNCSDQV